MSDLLGRFVDSFTKAVAAEMAAMRERLGPFEVGLGGGRSCPDDEAQAVFDVLTPNDKLVLGGECTFQADGFEALVTVTGLDERTVTLSSDRPLPAALAARLVIYPWFLYERLLEVIGGLRTAEGQGVESALRLFGRLAPRTLTCAAPPAASPDETPSPSSSLNEAQRRALALCASSDPAFVWGPPGTGKTTTLAHVVLDLLSRGRRLLVTSTTNAAVDQALAALAALPQGRAALDRGGVVRVGWTTAETFGASPGEVSRRRDERTRRRLQHLVETRPLWSRRGALTRELLAGLDALTGPRQLSLFGPPTAAALSVRELQAVCPDSRARRLARRPGEDQRNVLGTMLRRLDRALELSLAAMAAARRTLREGERVALREARVVLSTMTNAYINRPLAEERFDTVIVEEAGMAVLPTLFYCASLARTSTVMVGDPRQLPPIVQAPAAYVRKVMGRSIFEVTVPEAHESPLVVMLDTQYRMHPAIGDLVSDLFYDGRLTNAAGTALTGGAVAAIASSAPFPGHPLVVVDGASRGTCATLDGAWSRYNEWSALACVDLARQAVEGGMSSVAVIAPYTEHVRLVCRLLRERLSAEVRRCIECRTVHRFQGNERDLVIFDLVDAEPLRPGVLLTEAAASNLVNVSISRARGKLVILADQAYFARRAPGSVVDRLLRSAGGRGHVVTNLP